MQPRGIRNNNFGNIEDGPFARGLPGYTGSDGRFARFETPDHGMGAIDALLQSYGRKGLNTVGGVISKWAPPVENNTNAYAGTVAKNIGVGVDDTIDLNDPSIRKSLATHIANYENGATPMAMAFNQQGTSMPTQVIPQQRRVPGLYPTAPAAAAPADEGSLSAKFLAGGPGALFGAPNGVFQNADGSEGYNLGGGLSGAGAALASISSPQQGAALAQLAGQQGPKAGRYTTQVDKDRGVISVLDSQGGSVKEYPIPGFDPNWKQKDAYKTSQGKVFSDLNESIPKASLEASGRIGSLDQLKGLLSDDNVYQGAGGDTWNSVKKYANAYLGMNLEGVQNGDAAKSLMSELTLQGRNMAGGMPGSLSDKDLAFLKTMPPSLDNNKETNMWLIDRMKALHQRQVDVENWRQQYTKQNGMLDDGFYGFVKKQADANPIFRDTDVAPKKPASVERQNLPALPKGVKSIELVQ
jgi:hypothetical protein